MFPSARIGDDAEYTYCISYHEQARKSCRCTHASEQHHDHQLVVLLIVSIAYRYRRHRRALLSATQPTRSTYKLVETSSCTSTPTGVVPSSCTRKIAGKTEYARRPVPVSYDEGLTGSHRVTPPTDKVKEVLELYVR